MSLTRSQIAKLQQQSIVAGYFVRASHFVTSNKEIRKNMTVKKAIGQQ
ncbi:MAG: hypothetical protein AAGE96_17730 [Cyanobacteria bacterium P01_G01_bin.19]